MAMHCSPVVLLLWALCVTAFPYTWEDDRESAKDWLESARIQKSISRNKTREQRPTFVRHLKPKFGQDNPEQDNIQESTPNMDIFRNGQPPKFVRHLDPGILKVNQINRGIKRVAQYSPVTQGFIWKKTDLTYRIENYGVNLSPDDVVSAIERAFKVWSDVTPLTFTRIYSKADIEMKFVTGDHDDNNPFDPNTEYIAHAFQPGPHIGGDVHFNDAKSLTKTAELYNLFLVAAHEIGHALGLQHSDGPIDLMNPHYPTTDPKGYRLPQNDIDAIQRLYGPSPHNPFAKGPSACYPDQDYDAVTTLRGDMFFFTERYVLRRFYHSGEVIMDFIQTYWKFLPFDIDAAYEDPDSDTMIVFKGPKYWEFGSDLNLKYKGSIYNLRFPKGVRSIDAAVFVPDVEKAYFFAGEQYWRYDKRNNAMDKGFPRPIPKDFPGVGPQVTAAVYTEGKLYLFDSNALHEVSMNAKGQVVGHINQFPKDYWTRC